MAQQMVEAWRRGARFINAVILVFFLSSIAGASSMSGPVKWQPWNESVFSSAKTEKKIVMIDLEAVWCHWCHVMDQKTYTDPKVAALLASSFIAVKVDQEAFPDLGKRYEDYGWPATVFLDGEGRELAIRSGYIEADDMATLLADLKTNPKPRPREASGTAVLKISEFESTLRKKIERNYDDKIAGWNGSHKYLDRSFVEDQISLALSGDGRAKKRVVKLLGAARKLVDPAWGGAYQYSVGGNWDEAHFEKIMNYQSDYIYAYSLAYSAWKNKKDLETAKSVAAYLAEFLTSPEGAFYTSQDADVVKGEHSGNYYALTSIERKKLGIPHVDQHIYARENGWAIEALVALYRASGEAKYLEQATRAMRWIVSKRETPSGFRHGEEKSGPYYLGDQVSVGLAMLALYEATGEAEWLRGAKRSADVIEKNFSEKTGGFRTVDAVAKDNPLKPKPADDENIALGRFTALLAYAAIDSSARYREMATKTLAYLSSSGAADKVYLVSGLLLLKSQLDHDPLHITVIGAKADPATKELERSALSYPSVAKYIERLEPGAVSASKVSYPKLSQPAAFVCTGTRCSFPLTNAKDLPAKIDLILGRKPAG